MNANSTNPTKKPILAALEDGLIIAAWAFLGGLIAMPSFPPMAEVLYASGLAGALAFIVHYAYARGIQLKPGA